MVRRAVEGTPAAAGSANDTIRLISNSRTGAEINQNAVARRPEGVAQFCQTWQHPVQVGGSLQASAGYHASSGLRTPFEQTKMDALQNLMDDMEVSSYYGRGEDPALTSRPKQKGLKTLLSANNTTNPSNAGAYRASDFIRDTLEKSRAGGGSPDVLLLSTNFMTGLNTWGYQVMRIDAGTNVFWHEDRRLRGAIPGRGHDHRGPAAQAVLGRRLDLVRGADADEAERVLEPPGVAWRRLRRRLDGRGGR